ncbi:MAG: arsenic resistance N-acetyltransferase ArsN2 [Vogesella sp.]|uniref:arsenic resistance N-acetyltransferase ArsN2 n=1 Tax=Vogesella sp. TaxID=1904252 RepID=UPI00391D5073
MQINTLPQAEAAQPLLHAAGLPCDDVFSRPDLTLFGIQQHGQWLAVAGIERHGHDGLLRSVATAPAAQGQGLASHLLQHAEQWARHQGMTSLYLLTTSAAPYFARHGYQPQVREQAPQAIRHSKQFAGLCPASATLMHKTL